MYQQVDPRELRQNYSSKNQFFLESVTVDFGKIRALDSVHLSISPGEFLFITGASGAGKSTLLRLLSGAIEPTRGQVTKVVNPHEMSNVFQDLRLMDGYSCEDNLWFSFDKSIYKNKNEFYDDMVQLSKILGIDNRLHIKANKANGGLKQKVCIVRALLSRPKVLLADEPTASLDRHNAGKLYEVLNFYNQKRGLTVVWSSHNQELVKQFSGRNVHLNNGKLVYSGNACFI